MMFPLPLQSKLPVKIMKYHVGQKAIFKKRISRKDVLDFSRITGDNNPIHINDEYAEKSIFKKPIVHGMFSM